MSPRAQVEALYRAFRARDYAAFRQLCAPDLEWIQNPGFPGGGRHVGPEAVITHVFQAFNDRWAEFGYEIGEMLEAGDTVIVLGEYRATGRTSGKAVRAAAAHVYEFEAGKLIRYRQFADTKTLWDALEPR